MDNIAKKKSPSRTCLGCNRRRPQTELVRFVRTFKGSVVEDPTSRLEGRGAYICADSKERCLIQSIKRRAFERALPGKI
ncbi:MAG: YlxR family protein [bacterium]|nr:YlxR family protein [bacterium]